MYDPDGVLAERLAMVAGSLCELTIIVYVIQISEAAHKPCMVFVQTVHAAVCVASKRDRRSLHVDRKLDRLEWSLSRI